jgi:hypothetical protein
MMVYCHLTMCTPFFPGLVTRDDTCNSQTFIFIIRSPADAYYRRRPDKCKPEYSFSFRVVKQASGWLKVFLAVLFVVKSRILVSTCYKR